MYKSIITIQPKPGARDAVLARAPAAQATTRAEPGCIAFYGCTDDPNRLVFVETPWGEAAHAFHMWQAHTRAFIAFHEPHHETPTFETIDVRA